MQFSLVAVVVFSTSFRLSPTCGGSEFPQLIVSGNSVDGMVTIVTAIHIAYSAEIGVITLHGSKSIDGL